MYESAYVFVEDYLNTVGWVFPPLRVDYHTEEYIQCEPTGIGNLKGGSL